MWFDSKGILWFCSPDYPTPDVRVRLEGKKPRITSPYNRKFRDEGHFPYFGGWTHILTLKKGQKYSFADYVTAHDVLIGNWGEDFIESIKYALQNK